VSVFATNDHRARPRVTRRVEVVIFELMDDDDG